MRLIRFTLLILICHASGLRGQGSQSSYAREVNSEIDPANINYNLLNTAIVKSTNDIRRSFELDTLVPDKFLTQAAEKHAEYLAQKSKLVHINARNPRLKTPAMRVKSTGANPTAVGENLARMSIYRLGKNGRFFVNDKGDAVDERGNPLRTLTYHELAQKVTQGWLASEGHRENLLGAYTHIGHAEREMQTGKEILTELVFVQNFGKY